MPRHKIVSFNQLKIQIIFILFKFQKLSLSGFQTEILPPICGPLLMETLIKCNKVRYCLSVIFI